MPSAATATKRPRTAKSVTARADLVRRLLAWYDRHARVLPWRRPPSLRDAPDPYRVWLSEVMLQQTTVAAVDRYFRAFIAQWPTVADLAAAPVDTVLGAWAGLGYYARARNLHRCAQAVVERHDGVFPAQIEALLALPGIGRYTAAAVASIAFDHPVVPVDGNVERVVARLFAIDEPLPGAKPALHAAAQTLVAPERAGDFAQALMDLGATICTPRKPRCLLCPWQNACESYRRGIAETLPARAEKKSRPTRRGVAFVIVQPARGKRGARVWGRRRPPTGLLGGMLEIPSTDWRSGDLDASAVRAAAPAPLRWRALPGIVRHVFTHFELELEVWSAEAKIATEINDFLTSGLWIDVSNLDESGLPSVMKKIVIHALR